MWLLLSEDWFFYKKHTEARYSCGVAGLGFDGFAAALHTKSARVRGRRAPAACGRTREHMLDLESGTPVPEDERALVSPGVLATLHRLLLSLLPFPGLAPKEPGESESGAGSWGRWWPFPTQQWHDDTSDSCDSSVCSDSDSGDEREGTDDNERRRTASRRCPATCVTSRGRAARGGHSSGSGSGSSGASGAEENEEAYWSVGQSGAPPAEWTVSDVSHWLSRIRCPQYSEAFRANDIDGPALTRLAKDDLADLGVRSVGHRLHILGHRDELQNAPRPHQVYRRSRRGA